MTCLTCRHLLVYDMEHERRFTCGHDAESELDTHAAATVIAAVPFGAHDDCSVLVCGPAWCPIAKPDAVDEKWFRLLDRTTTKLTGTRPATSNS